MTHSESARGIPLSPFQLMPPFILTQNAENMQKQELDRTRHFEKINYSELSVKERSQLTFYLIQQGRDLPGEQYSNTIDCITVYIEKRVMWVS